MNIGQKLGFLIWVILDVYKEPCVIPDVNTWADDFW